MAQTSVKVMLITANVGSLFEDPENMVSAWTDRFMKTVAALKPGFLAIHIQEVGGKNYEETMQYVNQFVKSLLASKEMVSYDRAKIFLDEDFTAADKFTALGVLYFVEESVKDVHIWDFKESKYVPFIGKEVLSGNIESVSTKEKTKFPLTYFPDCKWSRKGFIRTRWKICDKKFDLVNIHLFHDASNIDAMESSPSKYVGLRQKALKYVFQRLENDNLEKLPYFLFGDFNFRLDTHKLIKDLTKNLRTTESRNKKNNELTKVVFQEKDPGQKVILTVSKKSFDHLRMKEIFYDNKGYTSLLKYDKESEQFLDKVTEFDVNFQPSYPFSEDISDGTSYMKTRCPGWCDRILPSHSAKNTLIQQLDNDKPEYYIIGPESCMGDHKPVYLYFTMNTDSGRNFQGKHTNKAPLGKVISINGEEICIEEGNIQQLNIHDFATFESEQKLHPITRASIKRRDGGATIGGIGSHGHTFSEVANEIRKAEGVLRKWKTHHRQRHHSSSSEDDDTDLESADEAYTGIEQVILEDLEENGRLNQVNGNTSHCTTHTDDIPIIVPELDCSLTMSKPCNNNNNGLPIKKYPVKNTEDSIIDPPISTQKSDNNDNQPGSLGVNITHDATLTVNSQSEKTRETSEPISDHDTVIRLEGNGMIGCGGECDRVGVVVSGDLDSSYKKRYVGRTLTPLSSLTDYERSPCPCKCCVM